jgi:hypothetical protein
MATPFHLADPRRAVAGLFDRRVRKFMIGPFQRLQRHDVRLGPAQPSE